MTSYSAAVASAVAPIVFDAPEVDAPQEMGASTVEDDESADDAPEDVGALHDGGGIPIPTTPNNNMPVCIPAPNSIATMAAAGGVPAPAPQPAAAVAPTVATVGRRNGAERKMQTSRFATETMPRDVWRTVMQYLDLRSLGRAARVCSSWSRHKQWPVVAFPTAGDVIGPFKGKIAPHATSAASVHQGLLVVEFEHDQTKIDARGSVYVRQKADGGWTPNGYVVRQHKKNEILVAALRKAPTVLHLREYGAVLTKAISEDLQKSTPPATSVLPLLFTPHITHINLGRASNLSFDVA